MVSNHPYVQKYTDEVRRVGLLKHKHMINKPWSKSNRYLKSKLVEHLANDARDLDIFQNTFRSRDRSLEPGFNLQVKAD